MTAHDWTERIEKLHGIGVAIASFEDVLLNPDGYCACKGEVPCYYHSVSLHEAIRDAETVEAEGKRIAAYLRSKLPDGTGRIKAVETQKSRPTRKRQSGHD